jgi:hypothetical protein
MRIRATLATLTVGAAVAVGALAGCGSDDDSDDSAQSDSTEQTTTEQSSGGY